MGHPHLPASCTALNSHRNPGQSNKAGSMPALEHSTERERPPWWTKGRGGYQEAAEGTLRSGGWSLNEGELSKQAQPRPSCEVRSRQQSPCAVQFPHYEQEHRVCFSESRQRTRGKYDSDPKQNTCDPKTRNTEAGLSLRPAWTTY